MKIPTLYSAAFSCTLALTSSAWAFDNSDRAAIEALSSAFDAAFETGDMAAVIGFIPPPIIEHIASQNGFEVEPLKSMLIQQTEQMMAKVTVEDFSMDLAQASTGTTATGRDFALVPTITVISMGGISTENTTNTLFFEDSGEWYLLRIENAGQIKVLNAVYPDFLGHNLQ